MRYTSNGSINDDGSIKNNINSSETVVNKVKAKKIHPH